MAIKKWDSFNEEKDNDDEVQPEPEKKYDISVNVDDTLEFINGIVEILLHHPKEGYNIIGELLDRNDKLITGFPKKGTDDYDKFHDDLFERLRRAIRIAIKHVNKEEKEDKVLKEGAVYQASTPVKFEKLAKAIEDAGFKNTYTTEEVEVKGRVEDGNIFIDDEPLNFTIFENDDVYWNDFSGSKKMGSLEDINGLIMGLKKFLTK